MTRTSSIAAALAALALAGCGSDRPPPVDRGQAPSGGIPARVGPRELQGMTDSLRRELARFSTRDRASGRPLVILRPLQNETDVEIGVKTWETELKRAVSASGKFVAITHLVDPNPGEELGGEPEWELVSTVSERAGALRYVVELFYLSTRDRQLTVQGKIE